MTSASAPSARVIDASPAVIPSHLTLEGRAVSLRSLDPASDARALYEGSHDDGNPLWRYLPDGPYPELGSFTAALHEKAASTDPLYFAILDRRSGRPVGYASYLRIDPPHRVIEIGSILYTRQLQRTTGATEAMYLMARHAFDTLGYRRYEWKCDSLNEPSRRAALRLGFTFEGIFRQHRIVKGRNRDTAWFSMLDHEWPRCRFALEAWLDPGNFDRDGRQIRRLEDIRDHVQR
jgi:RimJ/RimL family protein N-acetyltransferase